MFNCCFQQLQGRRPKTTFPTVAGAEGPHFNSWRPRRISTVDPQLGGRRRRPPTVEQMLVRPGGPAGGQKRLSSCTPFAHHRVGKWHGSMSACLGARSPAPPYPALAIALPPPRSLAFLQPPQPAASLQLAPTDVQLRADVGSHMPQQTPWPTPRDPAPPRSRCLLGSVPAQPCPPAPAPCPSQTIAPARHSAAGVRSVLWHSAVRHLVAAPPTLYPFLACLMFCECGLGWSGLHACLPHACLLPAARLPVAACRSPAARLVLVKAVPAA